MTPIETIEACVEHWRDNVKLFRINPPHKEGQWDWFKYHCFGDQCPACHRWLDCGGGGNCCGGAWKKAKLAACVGTLAVSHLEAVLAYIEKVLAKMKENA